MFYVKGCLDMQYETHLDFGALISSTVESEKDGNFEDICARAKIYPEWSPSEKSDSFNSRVREEIQHATAMGPETFSSRVELFDHARNSATEDLRKALDHVSNINVSLLLMQDAKKWLTANAASNGRIEKEKESYNRYVKTGQSDDGGFTEQIENATYKLWLRFSPKSYHKKPVMVIWSFCTNKPVFESNGYQHNEIAGGGDHLFDTVEAAQKYIAGRKKAYAKYFTEIQPPVLPEYARHFGMFGKLFDGYRIGEI